MYKLLAIGGPKDFEWLPWDGKQQYVIVPISGERELFFDKETIEENDIPDIVDISSTKYFVYTIGDHDAKKARRVYVNETITTPEKAKEMLADHLMAMFIGVGDLKE